MRASSEPLVVSVTSRMPGDGSEARDQLVDAAAHERLAAGDAQLLDAHAPRSCA